MPDEKPPVQYILVRKDLPAEVQMVNVGHAAGESIRVAPISKRTVVRLLHVADEAELRRYADLLMSKSYHIGLVEEGDAPYNGAAMALAVEPLTERVSSLSKLVYHLERVKING